MQSSLCMYVVPYVCTIVFSYSIIFYRTEAMMLNGVCRIAFAISCGHFIDKQDTIIEL